MKPALPLQRLWLPLLALGLMAASLHAQQSPAGIPTRTLAEVGHGPALLVGVGDYDQSGSVFDPLPGIAKDLDAVEASIRRLGWTQVSVLRNPTQAELRAAVDRFGPAAQASSGASFFYYSGHGVLQDRLNYMVPARAQVRTRGHLALYSLPVEDVLAYLGGEGSGPGLVFIDACRNNDLPAAGKHAGADLLLSRRAGLFIGFATAEGAISNASPDGSVYTRSLAQRLLTPGRSLDDIYAGIIADVEQFTQKAGAPIQPPEKQSALRFVLQMLPGGEDPRLVELASMHAAKDAEIERLKRELAAAAMKSAVPAPTPASIPISDPVKQPSVAFLPQMHGTAYPFPEPDPVSKPKVGFLPDEQMGGAIYPVPRPDTVAQSTNAEGRIGSPSYDRDHPLTNSLGMKFVPVPGTKVLFSVWETRVQDYAAYAAANLGVDTGWKDYEFGAQKQGPDHPVINVSWEDANSFCAWLSKKEGKTYRLPTDHEWSCAMGIGDRENATASPSDKNGKIRGYPWGTAWPPPQGAGNFSGTESAYSLKIAGYADKHAISAPVGSYDSNRLGLYDLGGNVWEWCEDFFRDSQNVTVLRGGSWSNNTEINLRSSVRYYSTPALRSDDVGFRVALEDGSGG